MPDEPGLRDGLARCVRWLWLMGFCDGTLYYVGAKNFSPHHVNHYLEITMNANALKPYPIYKPSDVEWLGTH